MDTSSPAILDVVPVDAEVPTSTTRRPKRQRRSLEVIRKIVEETFVPGASVARVAQAHGVNANLVFRWRNLYRSGRLGGGPKAAVRLLPVTLQAPMTVSEPSQPGAIHIKLGQAQIRVEGSANVVLLRAVLELLRG